MIQVYKKPSTLTKLHFDLLTLIFLYKKDLKGLLLYKENLKAINSSNKIFYQKDAKEIKFKLSKIQFNLKLIKGLVFKNLIKKYISSVNSSLYFLKKQKKIYLNFSQNLNDYGILKVYLAFTNFYLVLTTIDGKILKTISGGRSDAESRKTRLVEKSVIPLIKFIIKFIPRFFKKIKLQFTGPLRKLRGKIFKTIKSEAWKQKYKLLVTQEAYMKTFNGCKLKRKKRS